MLPSQCLPFKESSRSRSIGEELEEGFTQLRRVLMSFLERLPSYHYSKIMSSEHNELPRRAPGKSASAKFIFSPMKVDSAGMCFCSWGLDTFVSFSKIQHRSLRIVNHILDLYYLLNGRNAGIKYHHLNHPSSWALATQIPYYFVLCYSIFYHYW